MFSYHTSSHLHSPFVSSTLYPHRSDDYRRRVARSNRSSLRGVQNSPVGRFLARTCCRTAHPHHSRCASYVLYFTIFYSTLYSTLLYSTLLYSTLLYSTLLYSTLLYSTLLYSTLLYSTPHFIPELNSSFDPF